MGMWELDCEESWAPKNWRFWTVVMEKTLQSPLDCKEIQPVHPKGDQSWIFIGKTDAEAETPTLWPPDMKNWLLGKDPNAGKYWRQEEKGMTEDEMVVWHHQVNGYEFAQAPRFGDGQGGPVCCSPWGRRVRHDWATELKLTWSNYSQGIPTTCCFWNQFYADSTKGSWLNITMLSTLESFSNQLHANVHTTQSYNWT